MKWRKDGTFLIMLITKLVQNTEDVYMENVEIWDNDKQKFIKKEIWGHNDEASNLSKYNTFGNANRPNSLIHNIIRQCVKNSNTAAELLVNLDKSIKASGFSDYTYNGFKQTLNDCLKGVNEQ